LPGLSAPAIPGTAVHQVHTLHLPGDPPNVYMTALTVDGLQPGSGGVGSLDLLTGKYDVLTDTFTPDNFASSLNSSGIEFGLSFYHDGLVAVWDINNGPPPQLATRPNLTSPWQTRGTIGGMHSATYYDPAIANINGQPHLIYIFGNDIVAAPINLTTNAISGARFVLVNPARAGSQANSPTPIVDSTGELIGLSHHDVLGADNDHYLSLDLDPTTPAVILHDTTTWINNGGFIGGRFFDGESTTPYHVLAIDKFWFTGGRAAIGTTMEIRAFVPPTTSPNPYLSWTLISSAFAVTPTPVPLVGGLLALNPAVIVDISMPPHNNANGTSLTSLPVPNDPTLRNLKIPAQGITFDTAALRLQFTNTAALTIL
jgi:hypothetical protein